MAWQEELAKLIPSGADPERDGASLHREEPGHLLPIVMDRLGDVLQYDQQTKNLLQVIRAVENYETAKKRETSWGRVRVILAGSAVTALTASLTDFNRIARALAETGAPMIVAGLGGGSVLGTVIVLITYRIRRTRGSSGATEEEERAAEPEQRKQDPPTAA